MQSACTQTKQSRNNNNSNIVHTKRASGTKKSAKPQNSRDLLQLKADLERIEAEYKHNSLELQQQQQQRHSKQVQMSKRNVINTIILRDEDIQFSNLELDTVKVHVEEDKQERETSRSNSSSSLSVTSSISSTSSLPSTTNSTSTTTAPT